MSQAKITDELIISVIGDSEVNFDLGSQALSELKKANVSDAVIEAMKSAAARVLSLLLRRFQANRQLPYVTFIG
jgi:hypothetical protein